MDEGTIDEGSIVSLIRDEDAALERVRTVSYLLDSAVEVPGTNFRVGLDPLLGVVPGAGDSVAALISLYVLLEGVNLGASKGLLARMGVNVLIDAVVGSIPVLGTVFDAFWKANQRNARLLEKHVSGEVKEQPEWA